jgi:hypothetical protein
LRHLILLASLILSGTAVAADQLPAPFLSGLKRPCAAVVGSDGRTYVLTQGEARNFGSGEVLVIENGKAKLFVSNLEWPTAIAHWNGWLFVADHRRVLRIDKNGKVEEFAPAKEFPFIPIELESIAVD